MIRCQNGLIHLRLIDWNQKNNLFLKVFLSSLKRGGPSFIFREIMEDFFNRAMRTMSFKNFFSSSKKVIVPAPPKVPSLKDHAVCLSLALSELSQIPSYPALSVDHPLSQNSIKSSIQTDLSSTPSTWSEQKTKDKTHRKNINFQLKKLLPRSIEEVIFIDDILTTGSTACAAHKVLSPFCRFKIFTLAWRQKNTSHLSHNMVSSLKRTVNQVEFL